MFKSKKLFTFMFLLILSVFALAACGGSDEESGGDSSSSSSEGESTLETIKANDKIVWGVKNDTKLFGLKNPSTGEIEGFDVDIAKAVTEIILGDASKVEFKEVTSKTRIPMLNNGEIDAIVATMTITEERKQEVDFSDVYFEAGQSLLVEKGSDIQSIDDITADTKVIAVKGSTSAINIREKAPDAQVLEFENYAEAFTALKAGQGDTLTTDNAILYGMASEDSNFELVGDIFTDEPYGIAMKKGSDDFVQAVNDALAELKENGKYDEIYNKWINF
ncbi:transporter substrate-binding domain-containing protein [Ureibacillus aquaedulcis]|uniref:Transporter substrate-binding domain-containing protein n=1 Tax=Ureibacillus aquaedulcis TaxID=3058421 RepID=A0ABT8GKQ8_9BACL|nr:transporter substrate-binding domain-containing protein [Ureibacillus sp. BA0131]MDN4491998.1 transporter substrate-binding domain-containing protein [Ureibacillus sp. BA0131]